MHDEIPYVQQMETFADRSVQIEADSRVIARKFPLKQSFNYTHKVVDGFSANSQAVHGSSSIEVSTNNCRIEQESKNEMRLKLLK
jgi:hypothetical protein